MLVNPPAQERTVGAALERVQNLSQAVMELLGEVERLPAPKPSKDQDVFLQALGRTGHYMHVCASVGRVESVWLYPTTSHTS